MPKANKNKHTDRVSVKNTPDPRGKKVMLLKDGKTRMVFESELKDQKGS